MEAAKPSLTIAPRRSWHERLGLTGSTGVMLGAAVGLIAFSVFTLATSTRNEIAVAPSTSSSGRRCTRSSGSR